MSDPKTVPGNRWLLKVPRTPAQMKAFRKVQLARAVEISGKAPAKFTCDGCRIANICTLAFDAYNVEGDCLYEK
jgi:hypothetical protein